MKTLTRLACGTAAGLLLATGSVMAGNELQSGKRTLEGAWQVVTTVRLPADDCSTAPLVPPGAPNPFPSFNTFHEGGTMSEWGSRSPPSNRGSGHGVWEYLGGNKFGYRLMFHSFDDNGVLAATMDIRTELKLSKDGDHMRGVSRFVRTDISGNVLNFCATSRGTRFSY